MNMKKSIIITAVVIAPLSTAFAVDNPFGFETQKHPDKYEYCNQNDTPKDWYRCTTAPKPHDAFDQYLLNFVDDIGLCLIKGIGKNINNDPYGFKLKRQVDKIASQIAKKYGEETKEIDLLVPGSIWDEPRDWMMGLAKDERFYGYLWSAEKGFNPVGNIVSLGVLPQGLDRKTGLVIVEFYTKYNERCEEVINNRDVDSF